MEKELYGPKEVKQITGCKSLTTAYKYINELQIALKNENQEYLPLDKTIPIYYFRKKVLGEEESK